MLLISADTQQLNSEDHIKIVACIKSLYLKEKLSPATATFFHVLILSEESSNLIIYVESCDLLIHDGQVGTLNMIMTQVNIKEGQPMF